MLVLSLVILFLGGGFYLLYRLNKKKKETDRLDAEFKAVIVQYTWRIEKLRELVKLARTLAANGNQDAKTLIQGINEFYLNNYLDSNPVTVIGYNTFVGQYDKFVIQYKTNFNNLGSIVSATKIANDLLESMPEFDFSAACTEYNAIVFFESPKRNIEEELKSLINERTQGVQYLKAELSIASPNIDNLKKLSSDVAKANLDLSNYLKTIGANIEFDKAQKKTARQSKSSIQNIQRECLEATHLEGVTEAHLKEGEEFLQNINIALSNSSWGKDLQSDFLIYINIQNASVPILKSLYADNKMWKQSRTRQAPPRPGTNSRIGASQAHQNTRTMTRAQVMLHEDQIRRERNGNNFHVSSRVINSMDSDNYQTDVVANVVGNIIIDEVINSSSTSDFGGYGGGQTGGAGAGGDYGTPQQEQTYESPSYDEPSNSDD